MEVIDRNAEYEHATVGGQDANKQQVFYDYENWEDEYDKMYEDHAGEQGKQQNENVQLDLIDRINLFFETDEMTLSWLYIKELGAAPCKTKGILNC